jgi:hypothetical protein
LVSPDSLFIVHYRRFIQGDSINIHPPTIDSNSNGTPDFIDSVAYYLDFAHKMQVDSFGLQSPIIKSDQSRKLYNVYVTELGNLYGRVRTSEADYNKSYMEIDNDFQDESHKSKGYDGIKVGTMHEFHHSIQFFEGFKGQSFKYAENTATYLEHRFFPQLYDYFQYIRPQRLERVNTFLLWNDNISLIETVNSIYGYANFFTMLYEVYGDDVFLDYYKLVSDSLLPYNLPDKGDIVALDSALKIQNSTIKKEVERYSLWYYNATTKRSGKTFKDKDQYTELSFVQNEVNRITADGGAKIYDFVPFGIKYTRFIISGQGNITDDTLDIIHYNTYLGDIKNGVIAAPANYSLSIRRKTDSRNIPIFNGRYELEIGKPSSSMSEGNNDEFILIERSGRETFVLESAFPMPYNLTSDQNLFVPVKMTTELYGEHKVEILDASQNVVFTFTGTVESVGSSDISYRVIRVNPDFFVSRSPGVYIYRVLLSDGNVLLGKLALTSN